MYPIYRNIVNATYVIHAGDLHHEHLVVTNTSEGVVLCGMPINVLRECLAYAEWHQWKVAYSDHRGVSSEDCSGLDCVVAFGI